MASGRRAEIAIDLVRLADWSRLGVREWGVRLRVEAAPRVLELEVPLQRGPHTAKVRQDFNPWEVMRPADVFALWDTSREALAQWVVAQWLLQDRGRVEQEALPLLLALAAVASYRLVMPEWLARIYLGRLALLTEYRAPSIDAAFGPLPVRGTKRVAKQRRRLELMDRVALAMYDRMMRDEPAPVHKDTFEEIAVSERLNVSATTVEELYRAGIREDGRIDWRKLKRVRKVTREG